MEIDNDLPIVTTIIHDKVISVRTIIFSSSVFTIKSSVYYNSSDTDDFIVKTDEENIIVRTLTLTEHQSFN